MRDAHGSQSLLSQFVIILVSVFCGAGVWLVVQFNERAEITLDVEVIKDPSTDDRVELNFLSERVPVVFSYPVTELNKMRAENFRIRVELPDLLGRMGGNLEEQGDIVLSTNMVEARGPSLVNMRELNITPTEVLRRQIGWEARLRHIPARIEPQIGNPEPGYTYNSDTVEIEDSSELVLALEKWKEEELEKQNIEELAIQTEPIELAGRRGVVTREVELLLPEGTSLLPGESSVRTVYVEVVEETDTRILEGVALRYQFVEARLSAQFDPQAVDVKLKGFPSALRIAEPGMIQFFFSNIPDTPGANRRVAVQARLTSEAKEAYPALENIFEIETDPKTVSVTIIEEPSAEEGRTDSGAEDSDPALATDDGPTS